MQYEYSREPFQLKAPDQHAPYLDVILARYAHQPTSLLQILREAQEVYGYIHPDAIDYLITQLRLPRTKIEGVASFYSFLYLEPRGHIGRAHV